jgi:hypothetical protein
MGGAAKAMRWASLPANEARAGQSGKSGSQNVQGEKLTTQLWRRAPNSEKGKQAVEHCSPPVGPDEPAFTKLHLSN